MSHKILHSLLRAFAACLAVVVLALVVQVVASFLPENYSEGVALSLPFLLAAAAYIFAATLVHKERIARNWLVAALAGFLLVTLINWLYVGAFPIKPFSDAARSICAAVDLSGRAPSSIARCGFATALMWLANSIGLWLIPTFSILLLGNFLSKK